MAMKLSTTLSHITTVPNSNNSKVISEFYHYMKSIGSHHLQSQTYLIKIIPTKEKSQKIIIIIKLISIIDFIAAYMSAINQMPQ
jgi:hypothetical protein